VFDGGSAAPRRVNVAVDAVVDDDDEEDGANEAVTDADVDSVDELLLVVDVLPTLDEVAADDEAVAAATARAGVREAPKGSVKPNS
jgi:hypothetical protein